MNNWLTMDPYIVLSLANMKLRNFYPDLDALCDDIGVDRRALEDKLLIIGYHYERKGNHFVAAKDKVTMEEK
ncbi:MAG TPA: DUF4250 domain-containing protein [Bacillota bacterium]|nr:DUF4250 domain-containing protein [Bacillota bacterium]HPF42785.1 DUF4250 domain-containing protein [Bacillota bacterium]HPJ85465.1 DUF4250 domain-containing protein [Bacillota bacterium]HPQ61913.1 DUF4250 domain-containing protein [Bacillota bacterium]HRX91689.1 DUF4250 domain-containing protein [Candidatus Izemoplasmatales bacterium]